MIRLAFCLTLTVTLLASCSGPLQTRVQTMSSSDEIQSSSYAFAPEPDKKSEIYDTAKEKLRGALKAKGYEFQPTAVLIVDFAVANRPASIAIKTGEGDNSAIVTEPKAQKLLQSCKDNEHRLIISIMQRDSGKHYYRGTASEYHCKATLEQSLPHLIEAALTDLGRSGDGQIKERVFTRSGLE